MLTQGLPIWNLSSEEPKSEAWRGRFRHRPPQVRVCAAVAAAAWLLLAVLLAAVPMEAQAQETDIWTATLTTGEVRGGALNTLQGYGFHDSAGSLTDEAFTHDGVEYTIERLWHVQEGSHRLLRIKFSPNGRHVFNSVRFRLYIGNSRFSFDAAEYSPSASDFVWRNSGLFWSSGQDIAVRITDYPPNAIGVPTISGTVTVKRTLTASTSGISDTDGLTGATFTYQWIRVDADGMSNPTNLPGATSNTYVPRAADRGKKLRVRVRFTDDYGVEEELTSAATRTVWAVPGAPASLEATVRPQGVIDLSWEEPSDNGGLALTGYRVESSTDGAPFTVLAEDHGATSYTHDTGLDAGIRLRYRVKAKNARGASAASNIASATTDSDPSVTLRPSPVRVEEGGTATYTAVLTGVPSTTVTVTHASDSPEVTVLPESLTFRPDNWSVPQTLTVTAAQDADLEDDEATVTHSVSSAAFRSRTVRVVVRDNDRPSFGTLGARFYYLRRLGAIPGIHFGATVEVRVEFTQNVQSHNTPADMVGPDRGIRVTGGTVESLTFESPTLLRMNVRPSGYDDVTLRLVPLPCDAPGTVCARRYGTGPLNGLADRVSHTVRGVGDLPPAPTDLQANTVHDDGTEQMQVSFVGTDEATKSRVQWKLPDQDWSEAEEWWTWRDSGPSGRHSAVIAPVTPYTYDVRARWESPIGNGPWAETTRSGRPRAQWMETLTWHQTVDSKGKVKGAEVQIEYDRELQHDTQFSLGRRAFRVTYSESRALGHSVEAMRIIDTSDDGTYNPRTIKLSLSQVVRGRGATRDASPLPEEEVYVTYTGHDDSPVRVASDPPVRDKAGNLASSFESLRATFVPGTIPAESGRPSPGRSRGSSTVRAPGSL